MTNTSGAAPEQRNRASKSIGVWGATGSGKTTFLAALNFAVLRSDNEDLRLYGVDDTSTEFLTRANYELTTLRRFPDATLQVRGLSWVMSLSSEAPVRRMFGRMARASVPAEFNLDLCDPPGRVFGSAPAPSPRPQRHMDIDSAPQDVPPAAVPDRNIVEYLARCQGALLLIDPIRERALGDAQDSFQATLLRIAQHYLPGQQPGARLPQHVAVCITKFDDPEVYAMARSNGYCSHDESDKHWFPRVHDAHAERFFRDLGDKLDISDIDLVCSGLSRFFYPGRVRYFVTSAVGFHMGPDARFHPEDYQNVVEEPGEKARIRGKIHPINILEPVLWLGQRITAAG